MEKEKKEKNEIRIKTAANLEQACEGVESLLRSLKEGRIFLEHEGRSVTLTPEKDQLSLQVKTKQKGDKEGISIKLSWRKNLAASETGQSAFTISSKPSKPEPPSARAT